MTAGTANRLFSPAEPAEALENIKQSLAEKRPIIPAGRFSRLGDWSRRPAFGADFVAAGNLNQIVEFNPDDLAIRIGAGATPAELNQILEGTNLFWPVRGVHLENRSLGAILNEGLSGDEVRRYGRMLDLLMGVEMITPDGRRIKTGGATVKNVSGYDLTRLCWRAAGTLGFVLNVTLKLTPNLETKCLAEVPLADPAVGADLAEKIILGRLGAESLKIIHNQGWFLTVGLGDFREVVDLRKERLAAILKEAGLAYEIYDDPGYYSRPEMVLCSSRTESARARRRDLLNMVRSLAGRKDGDFYLEADITGEMARFRSLPDRFPGVVVDDVNSAGPVYRQLKNSLDPEDIFFPLPLMTKRPE
ncbi:FAD-binding oxidoreductase [Deltaproteobacteria bacterium OttesenSCG-928-M10]|nr:FAD-binding oxidoreductase [Deltaproteobacteria bacterium OttesenSCG-928-M10]